MFAYGIFKVLSTQVKVFVIWRDVQVLNSPNIDHWRHTFKHVKNDNGKDINLVLLLFILHAGLNPKVAAL